MIKTLDNFRIVTKSGEIYDMAEDFGIIVRKFAISSPQPDITTEKVENRNGILRFGKTWGGRSITATCSMFSDNIAMVAETRNALYRLFMRNDVFYVVCDAEPNRQWSVEVSSDWTPSVIGIYGEFEINFVSYSAFAESVEPSVVANTSSTFRITNDGDVAVDPRELPLTITFKGASTNLKIENTTTGDVWQYTGTTTSSDTILLDGIRATKNGLSIFKDTNRKLITLTTGWNDIKVTGASGSYSTKFEFRFYTI
ncbi:MAG: phage tail domain-containing protein [Bacillota bacterium]